MKRLAYQNWLSPAYWTPASYPLIRNAHDTANYLQFIQLLRKKLQSKFKSHKLITAAVATAPFNDASGSPSKKLPGWAAALDYFYIMVWKLFY
jgi:chitinase